MQKIVTYAALLISLMTTVSSASELTPLNRTIYLNQRWFTWDTCFDITTDHKKLGTVCRHYCPNQLSYELFNTQGQTNSIATTQFNCDSVLLNITNNEDQHLGTIENSLNVKVKESSIINSNGEVLAKAALNYWGTEYLLINPLTNKSIALFSRDFFRIRDNWKIEIYDPLYLETNQISADFFIVLLAFQSDKEFWNAQENNTFFQDDVFNFCHSPETLLAVKEGSSLSFSLGEYNGIFDALKEATDLLDLTEEQIAEIEEEFFELLEEEFLETFTEDSKELSYIAKQSDSADEILKVEFSEEIETFQHTLLSAADVCTAWRSSNF